MVAQAHTLRTEAKHSYDLLLFDQFRATPKRPEATHVEEVLNLLIDADRLRGLANRTVPMHSKSALLAAMEEQRQSHSAYNRTVKTLNQILSKYKWVSVLVGDLDSLRESLEIDGKVRAGYKTWENAMVRFLLDKLRTPGELGRFRHCANCVDWFFAATAHQRFCGEACRRHHTAASDEFKVKRRLYMKQVYRPQQKERGERMKELATGKIRAKKDAK